MRNETVEQPADDVVEAEVVEEAKPAPLLILAADDDLVCVDDLCLPAEARP